MTKQQIVNHISQKTNIEPMFVMKTIEAFISTVKSNVKNGEKITLRGFGSFEQIHRKQKHARNIKAGTNIIVPAHNEVKFYPSKYFKIEAATNMKETQTEITIRLEYGYATVKEGCELKRGSNGLT